jgi:predicted O-methyltransferase YrrM
MFKITKESLLKNREISEKMEGKTFHLHTHILYDIRTSMGDTQNIKYLEIGSYSGGSVSLMSSHPYPTDCYSVDLGYPIEKETVENNVKRFKNEKSSFSYIKGNSQSYEIINHIKNNVFEVDILFIDGDHSKRGATLDYLNYSTILKKGGYLIFDDYMDSVHSPEVKYAVDDIIKTIDIEKYLIIGSIKYDILKEFSDLNSSNLYIIKKL